VLFSSAATPPNCPLKKPGILSVSNSEAFFVIVFLRSAMFVKRIAVSAGVLAGIRSARRIREKLNPIALRIARPASLPGLWSVWLTVRKSQLRKLSLATRF